MAQPTETTTNHCNVPGLDHRGKFAPGNKLGKGGNPYFTKMAAFKRALYESVLEGDVKEVFAAMVREAKGGDVAAAKLVLQYLVGAPPDLPNDAADKDDQTISVVASIPRDKAIQLMREHKT